MTTPVAGKPVQTSPRRIHIVLRDGSVVTGGVYLTEGQALAPYLGSRKGGWANIVNATWASEGQVHNHAVLQADHIMMASSPDADCPVHFPTKSAVPREIDISLDDGERVQGTLQLVDKQRLSDYLSACGKFVPVHDARRVSDGVALGDIAVNCGCVKAVRDAKVFAPGQMLAADEAPVNRDLIRSSSATFEVITPGRIPDRRVGQPPYVSPVPAPDAKKELNDADLTPQQRARASIAARHWLVLLSVGAHLLPPDPRELSDPPTLDGIWHGVAKRNDVAECELAVQVAAAFKLEIANLEDVSADAIRAVPEKIARKLGVLPLRIDGKSLVVAVSDPHSIDLEQQLGFATKLNLRFEVAPPSDLRKALDWHYRNVPGLNS